MAAKKYRGTVINPFKVNYKDGPRNYEVGDKFETKSELGLQQLINSKNIKS